MLRFAAVLVALSAVGLQAADKWPMRTITIVAPGPAGSTSDIYARLVADGLSKELASSVIVENRSGVGTLLAAKMVAQAKPDGHTLLIGAAALAISPHVYKNMSIDPVRDFQTVRLIVRFPNVVVVASGSPVKSIEELLALVRANPGRYNFASGAVGISEHLAGELFKSMTNTDLVHVPFKGSADAAMSVVTGDALVAFGNMSVVLPHVKGGKLRAIAVTSATRSSTLPEVPTVAEAGVGGYEVSTWFGLLAPAGTSPEVIHALDQAAQRFLSSPETKERLRSTGAEPADEGPEAFAQLLQSEYAKWGAVVRKANVRAD
jgi:tripartite-type tricarboxylate transporter receptor subunit TctC